MSHFIYNSIKVRDCVYNANALFTLCLCARFFLFQLNIANFYHFVIAQGINSNIKMQNISLSVLRRTPFAIVFNLKFVFIIFLFGLWPRKLPSNAFAFFNCKSKLNWTFWKSILSECFWEIKNHEFHRTPSVCELIRGQIGHTST